MFSACWSSMCWGAIDCQWLWFIYVRTSSDVGMHVVCRAIHSRRRSSMLDEAAFHANPLPDALKGTERGANKHASWFIWMAPEGGRRGCECLLLLLSNGCRFRVKWIQRHNKQMKDGASSFQSFAVEGIVRKFSTNQTASSRNEYKSWESTMNSSLCNKWAISEARIGIINACKVIKLQVH